MGRFGKRPGLAGQEKRGPCTAALIFQNLPRESKARLEQAVFQWARWHALEYPEEVLDMVGGSRLSGKVQCDPALFLGESHAWMDLPHQDGKPNLKADFNVQYELESDVPRYDRQCIALDVQDLSTNKTNKQGHILVPDSIARPPRTSHRCFNCGSYGHGLKECWRTRDNEAIDQAKMETGIKAAHSAAKRYFLESPTANAASDAEFEGLQPGKLSTELRDALGLGGLDPPPWIGTMRQLGYPPGYLRQPPTEQEVAEPPAEVHFLDNAHAQPINLHASAGDQAPSTAADAVAAAPDDELTVRLSGRALDFIPVAGDDQPDMDLAGDDDDSVPPPPPLAEPAVSQHGDSQPDQQADQQDDSAKLPLEQVAFPGINAPIPEGADPAAWGVTSIGSPSQSWQSHKRAAPSDPIPIPAKRSRFSDPFPAPSQPAPHPHRLSHQHSWQHPPPMHPAQPHAHHPLPWTPHAHEQHAQTPPGLPHMPAFGQPPHAPGHRLAFNNTPHADAQPPPSPFIAHQQAPPPQWQPGPPPAPPGQQQQHQQWAPQNPFQPLHHQQQQQQQQQQPQFADWRMQQPERQTVAVQMRQSLTAALARHNVAP